MAKSKLVRKSKKSAKVEIKPLFDDSGALIIPDELQGLDGEQQARLLAVPKPQHERDQYADPQIAKLDRRAHV